MRLWASTSTFELKEFAGNLGQRTEASFGIAPNWVHRRRSGSGGPAHRLDSFGEKAIKPLPELYRSHAAVTGLLQASGEEHPRFQLKSELSLSVLHQRDKSTLNEIQRILGENTEAEVECSGSITVSGSYFGGRTDTFIPVVFHSFESFCLNSEDERFGTWIRASSYKELGSDPDVISAQVLIADVEVFLENYPG